MANRWQCFNCGYIHEGRNPPDNCPECKGDEEDFELLDEGLGFEDEDYDEEY